MCFTPYAPNALSCWAVFWDGQKIHINEFETECVFILQERTRKYGKDEFIKAEEMKGNEEEIEKIKEHLDKLCKEGFEKIMKENVEI